jgi:Amt family ammonium transporter
MHLLGHTRLDDPLDVFACHGVGGIVGALLTGVFATRSVNPAGADGLLYGNAKLLAAQLASVGATAAAAALGTAAILLTLRWLTALRPAHLGEARGIDATEHGEVAYALGVASLRWQRPSVNSSPVGAQEGGSHE